MRKDMNEQTPKEIIEIESVDPFEEYKKQKKGNKNAYWMYEKTVGLSFSHAGENYGN